MPKGTFGVTTPIYYINAAPHLGTAYTTVAADTIARYERMNGYDVSFVTGTDEHGQKIAETAERNGHDPASLVRLAGPGLHRCVEDAGYRLHQLRAHHRGSPDPCRAEVWGDLYEKGWLYKSAYELVLRARGDLLRRERSGEERGRRVRLPRLQAPVRYESSGEENWFFKLSEFQDKLLAFYDEHPDFIRPVSRKNEIVSFVKGGLQDLSISRSSFDWGIPVPWDEATCSTCGPTRSSRTSRASATATPSARSSSIAAGPFSTISWARTSPASTASSGRPCSWRRHAHHAHGVRPRLSAHQGREDVEVEGQWSYAGRSGARVRRGRYRYYFMSDVQFGHDGSISMERMVQVYNADLANTWGNLVSRVTNMTAKYFEGRVPERPRAPRTTRCARPPMGCMRNTTPAWPRWTSPGLRRPCRSWRAA